MFDELDSCIKEYEVDSALMSEYWHDDGIDDASEIMEQFQNVDWEKLIQSLPDKSSLWKRRLAYCLGDETNLHNLQVLQAMIDTDDLQLFKVALCFLMRFEEIPIETQELVRKKIEAFMPNADDIAKEIFIDFLKKKFNKPKDLKIFTDNIEDSAIEQINQLLAQDAFKDSKVRIMPDVHTGSSCVIGFTGDLGDKVIPSIVGGDIGCGMFCANLGSVDIDYKKLDDFIYSNIPSGNNVNPKKVVDFDFSRLYCFKRLKNMNLLENSLGTLGGGNHFIEIDESKDGEKYLIIHTGSRNLGAQVANYYQNLADQICNYRILEFKEKMDQLIAEYKETGRERELEQALANLKDEYKEKKGNIPYEFTYLEGKYREAYLHDMKICQEYAELNRLTIAKRIAEYMGWSIQNHFESVHNYISFDDNIVRKGSISAKEGEPVIIPMNMRDGCLIGFGKGNPDWNYSAPHGAGRIMSRKEASERIDLDEYQEAMAGIYTTSVTEDTRDEAPFVYKPMEEIMQYITPTVDVTEVIKPVYNFKASGTRLFKEVEDVETNTIVK